VEIRAGEIVDIAREQDTMAIHVRGKALASGRRGEKIGVLVTELSGTTAVEALVAGPGMVTLMF
jgi:flagella basal body P-ring formation protein FlgA